MQSIRKISAGFETDMNTLLGKYVIAKTARFTDFTRLWREMQFSLIFCGRKNPRECRLFFEEITTIILKLWHPSCDFQQRVFALYMLYGMYSTQPWSPKLKIRLRLCDWERSEEILQLGNKDQHLDVCYCIQRMRLENCFNFVAYLRQRTPITIINDEDEEDEDFATLKSEVFSNLDEMCKTGSLKHVALVHEEYMSAKAALPSSAVQGLDMVQENVTERIISEITRLQAEYKLDKEEMGASESDSSKESSSSEDEVDIGTRRRPLRQQQFGSTSLAHMGERLEQLLEDENTSGSVDASAAPMTGQTSAGGGGCLSNASTTKIP